MNLVLHTPGADELERLRAHFFEHAFDLTGDAGRWCAADVAPGDMVPILRITKGRTSFDVTRWAADEPLKIVTSAVSFADRCLIPTISMSSSCVPGAELQMAAGCWSRANPSEPHSFQVLAHNRGDALGESLIFVPQPDWENWLDASRDARDLLRA